MPETGTPPAPLQEPSPPAFEDYPLTRPEYINAVIHFYRGELARSTAWRARIDQTTNWAIVVMAAIFSFTFSDIKHTHVSLLFGDVVILLFLLIEARRYRRYDAWYARVRMIEENFYIPILRRNLVSPLDRWRTLVADDLMTPCYKITLLEAIGIRLVRNYLWLFLILLLGWLGKLAMEPFGATDLHDVYERMRIGFLPPGLVLACVAVFYAAAAGLALRSRGLSADREMHRERPPATAREWEHL
jgi:uncharacterized membrane protein